MISHGLSSSVLWEKENDLRRGFSLDESFRRYDSAPSPRSTLKGALNDIFRRRILKRRRLAGQTSPELRLNLGGGWL